MAKPHPEPQAPVYRKATPAGAPRFTCREDDTGAACNCTRFKIMKYQDGIHAVCEACDREYTLSEVVSAK